MEEGDLNLCCHVFITGSFVKETCGSLMETQTRKPLWNYVLFRGSTSERHVFGSLSVTQSQPMWIYGQRIGQNGPQRNRAMLKSLCISVNSSRSWRLIHVQQRRPSGPGCQDQTVRTRPALEVLYRMFGPSLTCMRVAAEVCQLLVCYRDFLRQVLRQVLYPSHSVTWSGMFTRPTLPLSTFIMHSPDVILY